MVSVMQQEFYLELRRAVSHERLEAYRKRGTDGGDENLFAHYAWNMALSESLYPSLQGLEVCLRNSIHDAASGRFGSEAWFDTDSVLLAPERAKVVEAKNALSKSRKSLEPGRVIAELTFGFWTSLFDVRYEQRLWPWLLKPIAPAMPKSLRTRKNLSRRFNKIRILRNRIFHHEPIWHWRDLSAQHAEMLEAVSWVSPAMRDFLVAFDRFPDIVAAGADSYLKITRSLRSGEDIS